MTQEYKGFTIPAYADTADAPKAFQDFTDDGPIPRFADATARDAAIATPVAGQMCYLNSTSAVQVYSGSAWESPWPTLGDITDNVEFGEAGTLEVKAGTARWYAPANITITGVSASVGTAPAGADIQVDVNKNGTTIFTTQSNRPIITAGTQFDASGTPDVTAMSGPNVDYLTVDIDQVGSSTPGSDLTVQIRWTRN